MPALCLALFAVHILHTLALQGDQGVETLLSALRLRVSQSSSDDHQSDAFTWSAFATRHIWRLVLFYTWPTLLLTAAYVVSQFGGVRRIAVSDRLLVPLLFAFGMTHIALFPQGSWIHDYWMFYLSAPLSLAAAEGALFLSQWRRLKILAGAALFVFPLVAIPETIAIHNWNDFRHWKFYHLGRLLNAHTRPDEIILKSAGDAWWDLSAPQTLYYAQRSGVGREPILDLQALEALLQDRDSGPYAFVLFHRKVDAGYFDVAVDDESRAVRFEERLAGEYPMEELEYEGHAFRLYHIGRRD